MDYLGWTIFLLTCPAVVLQVQVAPGSRSQLPPEGLKGRKSCCWQVGSEGRCRNSRGGISHGTSRLSGYREVGICGRKFKVHRLVAHAFLGPPPSEAAWQVNHIDGNCSNNRIDNLEWATRSENVRHSYATNPSRGNAGSAKARSVMIRPLGSCNWTSFSSIKLAAEAMSQPRDTVRGRCHRNSQVDGYEYKFAPVQQVEIPGEEWRPMIDPRSGKLVSGRMVSSLGRIKSKAGRIPRNSSGNNFCLLALCTWISPESQDYASFQKKRLKFPETPDWVLNKWVTKFSKNIKIEINISTCYIYLGTPTRLILLNLLWCIDNLHEMG